MNNESEKTQEVLGYAVRRFQNFRVWIPKMKGIYRPLYRWDEDDVDIGTFVGFVTDIDDKPHLVMSRVHTIWMGNNTWKVKTIPVLHNNDDRDVSDLSVKEFTLTPTMIDCLFKKETHENRS